MWSSGADRIFLTILVALLSLVDGQLNFLNLYKTPPSRGSFGSSAYGLGSSSFGSTPYGLGSTSFGSISPFTSSSFGRPLSFGSTSPFGTPSSFGSTSSFGSSTFGSSPSLGSHFEDLDSLNSLNSFNTLDGLSGFDTGEYLDDFPGFSGGFVREFSTAGSHKNPFIVHPIYGNQYTYLKRSDDQK